MNEKELHAFAQAAAKNIKTEDDLNQFRQRLTKITVEAAPYAERCKCKPGHTFIPAI